MNNNYKRWDRIPPMNSKEQRSGNKVAGCGGFDNPFSPTYRNPLKDPYSFESLKARNKVAFAIKHNPEFKRRMSAKQTIKKDTQSIDMRLSKGTKSTKYIGPNLFSSFEIYDQMGTIFGLGSSVHGGTELALRSSKATVVLTKYMGPESAIALKSTATYVGKVATYTSRGATFLSGGYSVYELSTNQAKAHTWVNLTVITLTAGAEIFIGVAAAPYIIVGGIAYGVFCIAGGNDWLDRINFKRWFN